MAAVSEKPPAAETALYIPGLDGLRALAVLGVLCYHAGFGWAEGGFLGVSSFFTLSGFLITTLMLREVSANGRIGFRQFWRRRARRLLPAALLTLAAVLVFHDDFSPLSTTHLRSDVMAAVGYVENWWLIGKHQSYGAIFSVASPVQHFWSLAIEEQFYLFFPLLFVGVHRLFRRDSVAAGVFAILAIGALAWGAAMAHGAYPARAYYATGSRAGELLIGVVFAYAVSRVDPRRLPAAAFDLGGVIGLAGLAVLWWRIDLNSSWLFPFGIAVNASCTLLVIAACLTRARVASTLSMTALRSLGIISYGVYLVHWPIFSWLQPDRVALSIWPLFLLRMGVTLAAAVVMFVIVESPVRRRLILRRRAFVPVIVAGMAAVVSGAVLVGSHQVLAVDLAHPPSITHQLNKVAGARVAVGTRRVLVIGDSVAWTASFGLHDWGSAHHTDVESHTAVRCGIGGPGTLLYLGIVQRTIIDCETYDASTTEAIARYKPETVLVLMGLADLSPRRFPDGVFRSLGDPAFDVRLSDRIRTMTQRITDRGARVVWATYPHVRIKANADAGTGSPPFVENEASRVDHLNALIRQTTAGMPDTTVIEFGAFAQQRRGGEFDAAFRPDGVHLSSAGSREAAEWFGPQVAAP